MSFPIAHTASTLRPGDKVPGHGRGWLTVKSIVTDYYTVSVTYIVGNPVFSYRTITEQYRKDEIVERV